MTNNSVIF